MRYFVLVIFFLLVSITLNGCGSGGSAPPAGTGQFASLVFNATTTKQSYSQGEAVPITVTVTNNGSSAVQVMSGSSADAKVYQGNTVIWQLSQVAPNGGGYFSLSIGPGETDTFNVVWDQKNLQGVQVAPGSYQINTWYLALQIGGVSVPPASREVLLGAPPVTVAVQ